MNICAVHFFLNIEYKKKKMHVVFIVLFLVCSVSSSYSELDCISSPVTSSDILQCLQTIVDTNHDGIINSTEVNTFYSSYGSIYMILPAPYNIRANQIIPLCDTNLDGVLTIADWPSACVNTTQSITEMCRVCALGNWTGPA